MKTFDEGFKTLVCSGDLVGIKSAVIGFIDTDKYMAYFQFRDAADYAHKHLSAQGGQGLFEKDDGKWALPGDKQEWSEALWQTLKVELMYDFSPEKLAAMDTLMRHLRSSGAPRFQVDDNAFTQYRKQASTSERRGENGVLPMCLAGGAVAGLVIGAVVKAKLAGVILGVMAGAGVYFYLKRKADKS
jgi:hypothetical protein